MNAANGMFLERFIDAQEVNYERALHEIKHGKKETHWMWYVFPQLKELGSSDTAIYFGIMDITEAKAYLAHPLLGSRLVEISKAMLDHTTRDPHSILGSPDDKKLQSSMTLFASLPGASPVFQAVLDHYYGGQKDEQTVKLLA